MSRMRRALSCLVCVVSLFFAACGRGDKPAMASGANAIYRFTDDGGRDVVIKTKPATVVSLAPSLTEVLDVLGKAGMLRGVTEWCDAPGAKGVERIGNMTTPDVERIIAIHPDIVVGTEMTPRHIYDSLEAAGITCIMFKHKGLTDVMEDMRRLADSLGEHDLGAKVVGKMEARKAAILAGVPKQGMVKVALMYDLDSMGSAGKGSWVDDMLQSVGLDNIANRAQSSWPRLSKEALLTEQPRFIILPDTLDPKDAPALRERIEKLKSDAVWGRVDAVREGRVIIVPANLLNIPGPRTLDAMLFLHDAVYGKDAGK
jgi:iron complex transport system substrate-binding protein